MNIEHAFADRIAGSEEFYSKCRSEQFNFVIDNLQKNNATIENIPASYEDEAILVLYNKVNSEQITIEEFKRYYEYHSLSDVLNILLPKSKHTVWCDVSESDSEELASVYASIWVKMLKTIGVKADSGISSQYDEENKEEGVSISFDYSNVKHTYKMSGDELDMSIFSHFDQFCENQGIDSVFLVDEFIGDEFVGGYILPKGSAIELAKYFHVDY